MFEAGSGLNWLPSEPEKKPPDSSPKMAGAWQDSQPLKPVPSPGRIYNTLTDYSAVTEVST